jgi:formylmethanofuran dehydrogenase subunit A
MEELKSIKPKKGRKTTVHIVHCQFNSIDGKNWKTFRSGAKKVANYLNSNPHATVDMGQVIFTDTTTMTGDGPWQFRLFNLTGNKWVNSDVEMEAGAGVVPYTYKKDSPVNAVQWAIGLELALLIRDPWQVYMTTDHPNGGPFIFYPKIISWLMSQKAREEAMTDIHKAAIRRSTISTIDREYGFFETAIITRAATAKALGLKNKGHLGRGAHADVSIYKINPMTWNPVDHQELEKALTRSAFTIKEGRIIVKDGEVISTPLGRTYWIDVKTPEDVNKELMKDLESSFNQYYTVGLNNYSVQEYYVPTQESIKTSSQEEL